jgi:serine protease Do
MPIRIFLLTLTLCCTFCAAARAQDRRAKVLNDRAEVEADGYWIYNDLPRGIEEAQKTGKPLLVVFRCLPCEACAQLDSDVVERDPLVRLLLDRFVCVRIVHANAMDLSLFDFDYDQSLAAFLMNADKTIYGRYGTRSHQTESDQDVSLEGFAAALEAALELHRGYPANRAALAAKRGGPQEFPVPEQSPAWQGKYAAKLDYEGKVVQSCLHCHQVGEAKRLFYRAQGKPIPEKVLFPYPHPKVVGLQMSPKAAATVREVTPDSSAAQAGFKAGDRIIELAGQPLVSTADMQWILHNAGDEAALPAVVSRGGEKISLELALPAGWRRKGDISWRATSWDLRRLANGGVLFEELNDEERKQAGLEPDRLALRAKHVGEYGEHAAAKNAGFRNGDILVELDGQTDRLRETDLLTRLINERKPGDKVPSVVLRDGKRIELKLPIQ